MHLKSIEKKNNSIYYPYRLGIDYWSFKPNISLWGWGLWEILNLVPRFVGIKVQDSTYIVIITSRNNNYNNKNIYIFLKGH